MKNYILFLAVLLTAMTLKSQNCDSYYPSSVGSSWEITHYDTKDKVESVQKGTVISAEAVDGGIQATISTTSFDNKNKEVSSNTFTTYCKDGVFSVDMKAMLDPEMLGSGDFELQIESSNMDLPANLSVGQKLPDAWIKMSIQMEGMPMMGSQSINITNRVVDKFETITTPAGTFNCVKISYDTELKSMFSIKTKTIEWYAVGVGAVRSEYYDSKGKLQGYSVLTKLSK